MAGKLTKRQARQVARAYVARWLRAQDEPHWPFSEGHIAEDDHEAMIVFMDELLAIAARVEQTITEAARSALTRSTIKNETRHD